MSFRAVLWVLEQDLPPVLKLILLVIASHASVQDGSCFPKISTIAREASLCPRTVHRHLTRLSETGLVRIERKYQGKARLPHKYWLTCPLVDKTRSTRPSPSAAARTPYDSRGRTENHYSNHNLASQVLLNQNKHAQSLRTGPTREQAAAHAAQCELARRLGHQGWEILATFPDEVDGLCARLRRGALTSAELRDLKLRYIESGGGR